LKDVANPMSAPTAPFPKAERVVYGRNPLHQVVCQIRFPALLRLQAQAPFEFQESIQASFPIYREPEGAIDLPPQLVELIGNPARKGTHRFQSEDSQWTLSVDPGFLALTCSNYESWDKFSSLLFTALKKFAEIYRPSFYSRIGLRYQNLIRRTWVDEKIGWDRLINPSLVGPLADQELESRLRGASSSLQFNAGEEGDSVHFQYGLAEVDGEDQRCFLLDFDYFYDLKTEDKDVENVINRLYRYSGPAFQWAITPTLHQAMEPRT
jgi:uncharacterized protein (TIGR04255 family)